MDSNNIFNSLSKRELFAMYAMQGLAQVSYDPTTRSWTMSEDQLAKNAVIYADAVLNELNPKP